MLYMIIIGFAASLWHLNYLELDSPFSITALVWSLQPKVAFFCLKLSKKPGKSGWQTKIVVEIPTTPLQGGENLLLLGFVRSWFYSRSSSSGHSWAWSPRSAAAPGTHSWPGWGHQRPWIVGIEDWGSRIQDGMFQDPGSGSGGLESKGDLKERGLVQDSRGDRALLRHQKAQKAKKKSFR